MAIRYPTKGGVNGPFIYSSIAWQAIPRRLYGSADFLVGKCLNPPPPQAVTAIAVASANSKDLGIDECAIFSSSPPLKIYRYSA